MRARELGLAGKRNRCRNSTAGFVDKFYNFAIGRRLNLLISKKITVSTFPLKNKQTNTMKPSAGVYLKKQIIIIK